MRLLPEIVQDVKGNFANTVRVQQDLPVFSSTELFLILFGFDGFELWANVVVVHLELEHFFITNSIGDDIRVQLPAKHTGSGVCAKRILCEDGGAGTTKLIEAFKLLLQVLLCLTKLT